MTRAVDVSGRGVRVNGRSVGVGSAIPDSVIEDFSTDLNNYSGDVGVMSRVSTSIGDGQNALQHDASTYTPFIGDISGSLSYYPTKGDVLSCLLRESPTSNNNFPNFMFGVDRSGGSQSGYGIQIDKNNELEIVKFDDESKNVLKTATSVGLTDGTWYDVEAQWHDGTGSKADNTIVASVYEYDIANLERGAKLASIETQNNTYADNQGVGFACWTLTGTETPFAAYYRKQQDVSDL